MRFNVQTPRRNCFVDITDQVAQAIHKSGVKDGLVTVYIPHTTAGVTIQENADPDVVHDVLWKLEQLIPQRESGYLHGEGNSDAHIKSSLFGCSAQVPLENGRMTLGTWQGIYFCEFDGPRTRQVIVTVTA